MSDQPTILRDFEFHFRNGAKDYAQAVEGRDTITIDALLVRLVIHHDDGAIEDITIERDALASIKQVRREIPPESRV